MLAVTTKAGTLVDFGLLYERHKQHLWFFCLKMLGDRDAASDVLQDTFLRACSRADELRDSAKASSWLFQIARNLCYDKLQRDKRFVQLDEVVDTLAMQMNTDAFDRSVTLLRALMKIPVEQREAGLLCDVEGYSYQEIATIAGTTLSKVKVRIFRGREKLREILLQEGFEL